MGTWSYIKGVLVATWSGTRHFFRHRITLRYPDQKQDLEGQGYRYDARQGVGLPGFKGRHILRFEKCTGCQLCAIACDGVAVAIDMQKVEKGKPQNKKEIWPAVDYGRCVPSGTPVMTSNGIVPIEQIKVGDKVLTHKGNLKSVTKTFQRQFTGKMFTFKTLGNSDKLSVTEGHPVLAYSGGTARWVDPSVIRYKTYLTRPIITEVKEVPALSYDYELYHPTGRGGYFTVEVVSLQFTHELGRLVGYYLSEGSCDRYQVSFSIDADEEALRDDIARCVMAVFNEGVDLRPDARQNGLKVVVESARAAGFFKQFEAMQGKALPPWGLTLPTGLQSEIIRAAYWGDGYCSKRRSYRHPTHSSFFAIRTASKDLATQYTYLLSRLGILSSINITRQRAREPCFSVAVHSPYLEKMGELIEVAAVNSPLQPCSSIKMTDDMVVSPVVEISVRDVVEERVYNLEVQDDNSYVASNISVHNCVFCGLCVDACPFDALDMTNDYELAAYDKMGLKYTPDMLAVPPKLEGKKYKVKFDTEKGVVTYD
ncbi:MAG: 4Fe-4S binding protein [Nitrososphaerota archaeon]|nr:4Fe-4S binding protein [Nitrososphaerota archaeon]MDG6941563.1 4Fe-4S binding protein [Nitrososphaerota archaeon]MDG6951104.1 4Fe-4S binding protein [Nitrososphaerota archaeon]